MISPKLPTNFIEITLRHGCFPVNLLLIFRTPFTKNASGRLLLSPTHFISLCLKFKKSSKFKKFDLTLCLQLKSSLKICSKQQIKYIFDPKTKKAYTWECLAYLRNCLLLAESFNSSFDRAFPIKLPSNIKKHKGK